MNRNLMLLVLFAVAAALIAGCGGGGGGGGTTTPPTNTFVLTGRVQDDDTKENVFGAKVTVGTQNTTTNSAGLFRLEMSSRPIIETYSVDGSSAGPSPWNYYNYWARAAGTVQNAKLIKFPVMAATGGDLGTIYLKNGDTPPIFPP